MKKLKKPYKVFMTTSTGVRPYEEVMKEIEEEHNRWYNKYFLNHFYYIYYRITDFPKKLKWFYQRKTRGFDDNDVWDLGTALKNFLAKRMEVWLKKGVNGHPPKISYTKWKNILKEILWWARDSFDEEDKLSDKWMEKKISQEEYDKQFKKWHKRVKRATEYLGKYTEDLWD